MDPRPQSASAEALTGAILARTSGAPCRRVEALACDFADGLLEPGLAGLVRDHAGHCPACAALLAALAEAGRLLPALAGLDPGEGFLQDVIRSTSRARRPAPAGTVWLRLLHRPRICLETAYLGAACGLIGICLPHPAPDWFSSRTPALVRVLAPGRLARPLTAPARRLAGRVARAERRTAASVQRHLPARSGPAGLWRNLVEQVQAWVQSLRSALNGTSRPANP